METAGGTRGTTRRFVDRLFCSELGVYDTARIRRPAWNINASGFRRPGVCGFSRYNGHGAGIIRGRSKKKPDLLGRQPKKPLAKLGFGIKKSGFDNIGEAIVIRRDNTAFVFAVINPVFIDPCIRVGDMARASRVRDTSVTGRVGGETNLVRLAEDAMKTSIRMEAKVGFPGTAGAGIDLCAANAVGEIFHGRFLVDRQE